MNYDRLAYGLCIALACLLGSNTSQANPVANGGFESANFNGWSGYGYGGVVTKSFGSPPTEGTYQGVLTTGGKASDKLMEEFLGLTKGTLDAIGGGNATFGSVIKQTLKVKAGQELTFDFKFLCNDYPPYNDFAFFATEGKAVMLDNIVTCGGNPSKTPFRFESPAGSYTHTFATSGVVTIGFGVIDLIDSLVDSGLIIDNVVLHPLDCDETDEVNEAITLQASNIANSWDYRCATSSVKVFNQKELDSYLSNYGWNGRKFQNLNVRFNPSGDVFIHSPCSISVAGLNGTLDIVADRVCVYGRRGVHMALDHSNKDVGISADSITLASAEQDAVLHQGLTVNAKTFLVEAYKHATLGLKSTVNATSLRVVSTGDVSTSYARVRKGSVVQAGDMLVSASRYAKIGDHTAVAVSGNLEVVSTGSAPSSVALLTQSASVKVHGDFFLISGNKASLGDNSYTGVKGLFTMNAASATKCTIKATAGYTAGATAGNCL